MRAQTRVGTGVVAAALLLAGCGDGTPAGSISTGVTVRDSGVTVRRFAFEPAVLSVEAGTTVEWRNEDGILHTATSGLASVQGVPGVSEDVPARPDGTFDLELDGVGATATFTFEEPGQFEYFCAIHAGMEGRIDVADPK